MNAHKLIAGMAIAAAAAAGVAFAGDEMTSLSYISYLERYATVQAAEAKDGIDAVVNMPVITGDRLDTARGARVEVQLADGSTVWLDEFSTLDFDALAASRESPAQRTVLFLQEGTAAIEIPATAQGDGTTRWDFSGGTVFLSRPGLYRFDLRSRQLHVVAHEGLAELPAGVGSVLLRTGQEAVVSGSADVQKATLAGQSDDFWSWVDERRHPAPATRTAEVVGPEAAGRAAVLDSYGSWVYVDAYSTWAWRPYVQAGWTPYGHGRWYWTPVGWNWVSYEPWGWYPYHYGSWYMDASYGWLWCWDWVWGPAWVHWMYTPGYIGWCPRGYYDWPYYDHHHNGDHDGHGGPGGPGGPGHQGPGRWGTAYDFSGNVRLRDVDPRPWNMVPANQFTNSRLDRVRVDPSQVLRDAGDDVRGVVRSGPLVTRPSLGDVERGLDGSIRSGSQGRPVANLDRILGRDRQGGDPAGEVPLRPVRTGDLVSVGPRTGSREGGSEIGSTPTGDRTWSRRSTPIIDVSGSPRAPRATLNRGGATAPADGGTPATARSGGSGSDTSRTTPSRETSPAADAPRAGTSREPASAPARQPSVPRSREVERAPSQPAPAKPPPSRRLGYTARIRSYDQQLTGSGSAIVESGRVREERWVVSTPGGERGVRTSSTVDRTASVTVPAGRAIERLPYSARTPVQVSSPTVPSGTSSRGTVRGTVTSPAPYSHQSPSGSSSPRSASPSSASSPRSYSPSSAPSPRSFASPSGGSYRAAPAPSHSGSAGSHPHGRR